MDSKNNQAFDRALAACAKLQVLFPDDVCLKNAIGQLKKWRRGETRRSPATYEIPGRHQHGIFHALRPLCEEVATLVQNAELQAKEMNLA